MIQVGDGHPFHGPVKLLLDEHQVQDPDDAPVDQVDQKGQALPGHPAAGELDYQVVDRTHLFKIVCHVHPSM